jgi:alpha-1,2-mannosyltransferase
MGISIPARVERIIGPLPGQREARAFSVFALIAGLIACGLSLYYGFRGEPFMGRPMGSDFVQFYAAGKLLNQHQPERIYDVSDFSRLQHEILPAMSPTQMLIFAYPPVVGQLFRPFALLPYKWAYCAWLVFSLALYSLSLWLLFRGWADARYRRIAFLLSLSAPMYTLETWMGAQLSVLAFFAVVLFISCFEKRWPVLAGLALGLATYKPSLMAIPVAMMLVGGCWRMLAGFGVSSTLLVLGSVATAGVSGFRLWMVRMKVFTAIATTNESILRRTKYVDLNSCFSILFGASSTERAIATVATSAAFLFLAWSWRRSRRALHEVHRYLWAATLTWTLLINIYAPVYDTILLVPAAALVARSLADQSRKQEQAGLQVWLIVLWLAPWVTQSWADYLRLQILTPVLAGFGYWALTLARDNAALRVSVPREDAVLDAA